MNNFKETLLDFRDDTLDFIDEHRLPIIIISILLVILIVGGIILKVVLSPVKVVISNANTEMGNIIGTKAKTLEFTAVAKKNSKVLEAAFEWEVSGGKIQLNEDGSVIWELPVDEGTYTITAKSGEYVGSKNITVIGNELSGLYKNANYQILVQDTDGDGLPDLYEGSTSRTSQTSVDTDNDGLYDGDEIIMGLDPLTADSKGDGLKDGERKLEYTFTSDNISMEMVGKGNFTQTSVDIYPTETLDNVSSVIEGVYSFYTEVALDSAEITIKYNPDIVAKKGANEDNLAVYELNEEENSFKKLKSTIDASNNIVTFNPENSTLGKYFIADSSVLTSNLATELVFVIDNSGSMYSKAEFGNSEENDPEFKRVDAVNALVDKLQGNYRFGVGKFTFEYKDLVTLSSDKTTIKNRTSSIKTDPENFSGTYIGAGLEGGLKQFSNENNQNRRYIILLSDGKDDTGGKEYNNGLVEEQILVAKNKGVKVYTVGLGKSIDESNLRNIAEQTKGKYYFAATAEDLNEVFEKIAADLNYNLYDSNNDDIDDTVIIADSGFVVRRNGFAFSNFSNSQVPYGYGYGMVLYAKLFYENNLPGSLSAKTITTNEGVTVTAPDADTKSISSNTTTALATYMPKTLSLLAELPENFWSSSTTGSTLAINSGYKNSLKSLGFSIYTAETSDENAGFKKYESIQFNIDQFLTGEDVATTIDGADIEMLRTLARLDITKYRDDKFNFFDNNDTAFNNLKTELLAGRTVMLRLNDDYTVLATKLLADSKNMNKYKIEVYDPNYAGIPKYIEVERNRYSDITEISKLIIDKYEYKFKYQGTDVGVCISIPNVEEKL
ncbi:MAG: VWA domain-containing protein [Clostridia bacterium]|nr:VWA domain-containing protein [Clostridia bacterium]